MFRKLRDHDGTPLVALNKGDLQIDGVLDDEGALPIDQQVHVQRLGDGNAYLVRLVDDGKVPDLVDALQPLVRDE
ncbi:hypothetical protein [Salinigranum halophilum]|uniref:hypothetical protein n=1 Tax=Salinigranum halophilum TaxID=2565931 RepID=UPI00115D9DC4|nr:hypothetical protein [Salinigranum halophilum]